MKAANLFITQPLSTVGRCKLLPLSPEPGQERRLLQAKGSSTGKDKGLSQEQPTPIAPGGWMHTLGRGIRAGPPTASSVPPSGDDTGSKLNDEKEAAMGKSWEDHCR